MPTVPIIPRLRRAAISAVVAVAALTAASPRSAHATIRPTLPSPDQTSITAFEATVYPDQLQRQTLVKNGRIYERVETDWNTWRNVSRTYSGDNQIGEGEISAIDTEFYSDGAARQFITRGGEVYRRIQSGGNWGAWEWITPLFDGVGQGRITSFGVALHSDGLLRQTLVRAGRVYRREQHPAWGNWVDVTQEFASVGNSQAPITAVSAEVYNDGVLRWFVVRGNQVFRRLDDASTWESISTIFQPVGNPTKPRVPNKAIHKRVLVLEYNPIIESQDNDRLNIVMRRLDNPNLWFNPLGHEQTYIESIEEATDHLVQYTVADRIVIDGFPPRREGYYTDETYLSCFLANPKRCDTRENMDYNRVIADYHVCERVNAGEIDELWLMVPPFTGAWEANMTGPNAVYTNGNAINAPLCQRSIHIMGFSYEREPGRMLEDMGHRIEGTMRVQMGRWWNDYANKGRDWPEGVNLFERFTARGFDRTTAACGNIHGSLNTPVYDPANPWMYDYRNTHQEPSTCNDWENYPYFTGEVTGIDCNAWHCADMPWHIYWLSRIPNYEGSYNSVLNNWWLYIVEWDATRPPVGS